MIIFRLSICALASLPLGCSMLTVGCYSLLKSNKDDDNNQQAKYAPQPSLATSTVAASDLVSIIQIKSRYEHIVSEGSTEAAQRKTLHNQL